MWNCHKINKRKKINWKIISCTFQLNCSVRHCFTFLHFFLYSFIFHSLISVYVHVYYLLVKENLIVILMHERINCWKLCNYNCYIFVIRFVNYIKWLCLQMLCHDWKLIIWEHFRTWQHNNESRSEAFFGRHDGNGCGFNISCHSYAELAQNFPGILCILSDFQLLLVIMKSHNDQPPIRLVFFCHCLSK